MKIKVYHGTDNIKGDHILSDDIFNKPENNYSFNLFGSGIYFYDKSELSEKYVKTQIQGGKGKILIAELDITNFYTLTLAKYKDISKELIDLNNPKQVSRPHLIVANHI